MSLTKIGIAIYAQKGSYNRPRNPHWALVLHPASFTAQDSATSLEWATSWGCSTLPTFRHSGPSHSFLPPSSTHIPNPSDEEDADEAKEKSLPGFGLDDLDIFIKRFPATKNGDDPSALFVWTCESYVIRILAHLRREGALELPCKPEEMYDYTKRRIAVLKSSPKDGTQICTIPFAE
ncbi:hypothetical protein CVT25_003152 [Psilocybe cyanescens]|uniref:Uncharacterized protein n=1 Tax=Psilocybe cyanescens TaxID=93625 RepID=A0A409X5N4_PSICY|nr:hypothetical protein CVT25_003152 [Psilocybe cyanescens]